MSEELAEKLATMEKRWGTAVCPADDARWLLRQLKRALAKIEKLEAESAK